MTLCFRFRGFYVKKGAPADRVEWLQWAFQKAFCTDSYQKYNESKFMNLIDSYRGHCRFSRAHQ